MTREAAPLLAELQTHKAELVAALGCPDHPDQALTWLDDRAWIYRWRTAGPTLAEREPVLRAWLEAAPAQPLPRGLPAVELARLARNHGITVEVAQPVARDPMRP